MLHDWLAKHPDDAATRLLLAQYYMDRTQNALAASQYELVLKAHPTSVGALNNLAWIYTEQHNPKALALAEQAYKLAPQSPGVADTYAWALIAGNQPKTALPILVKAAKAAPKEPSIQYHLAVAQARTGDKAGARVHARGAAEIRRQFSGEASGGKTVPRGGQHGGWCRQVGGSGPAGMGARSDRFNQDLITATCFKQVAHGSEGAHPAQPGCCATRLTTRHRTFLRH